LLLIVFDPPLDDGFFLGSGLSHGVWVSSVRQSQIEVMGRVLDVDHLVIWHHIFKHATCVPWIEVSVRENDVRSALEILGNISSSEVVQCPVVLWLELVLGLALSSVGCFVPIDPGEARLRWIISLRHWELVTSLNFPSTGIKSSLLVSRDV